MEQKPKELDLNSVIVDYFLKKGYGKSLSAFTEETQVDSHAAETPVVKERAADLLLDVFCGLFHCSHSNSISIMEIKTNSSHYGIA